MVVKSMVYTRRLFSVKGEPTLAPNSYLDRQWGEGERGVRGDGGGRGVRCLNEGFQQKRASNSKDIGLNVKELQQKALSLIDQSQAFITVRSGDRRKS